MRLSKAPNKTRKKAPAAAAKASTLARGSIEPLAEAPTAGVSSTRHNVSWPKANSLKHLTGGSNKPRHNPAQPAAATTSAPSLGHVVRELSQRKMGQRTDATAARESTTTTTSSTDLATLMKNKSWLDVVNRINSKPLEAQRCHYVSLDGIGGDDGGGDGADKGATLSRVLPLHLLATLHPPVGRWNMYQIMYCIIYVLRASTH